MKYRRLGNSGLLVSELALGTMIFGENSDRGTPKDEAMKIIRTYLQAGGNHFDLANVYAGGAAEEIVGEAIHDMRHQVVLTTKVRWPMGEGPNDNGLSRYHVQNSVESSLRRLQTDTIDVLYMHGWDPFTPLDETLKTFDRLISAGKVRYIGVSNFKAWQVMKALGLSCQQGMERFIAAQYQYSLVVRDIESEFQDLCQSEGLGLVPWGPLGGGFLSGKYKPSQRPTQSSEGRLAVTPDAWEESWARRSNEHNWRILEAVDTVVAAHPGSSSSQVALAWVLAQPAVASVIVGARTAEQLHENLKVTELTLAPEEISRLNDVSATTIAYPYRSVNIHSR